MNEIKRLSWVVAESLAQSVAQKIIIDAPFRKMGWLLPSYMLYGVPRGGIPVALLVQKYLQNHGIQTSLTDDPAKADIHLDDLVDSGNTRRQLLEEHGKPFYTLLDKRRKGSQYHGVWVVFPWEEQAEQSAADIGRRLLQYIGEDVGREGLRETPARFAKALGDWFSGYGDRGYDSKSFTDGAEGYDGLIAETNIPVFSHCEHHIAPFFGVAHIGYIPDGRIIGLSKLPRLVSHLSRRLQVQERLTAQIAGELNDALTFDTRSPLGVAVVLQCRHTCMESRGIRQPGIVTTTSSMLGVFREHAAARAEFLAMTPGVA